MKASEAPPAGWYPDPAGGVRLRWWDGSDWTEQFRSRPSIGQLELAAQAERARAAAAADVPTYITQQRGGLSRAETAEIISQVRQAARSEVDRAADLFSQRARAATREIQPLISAYTSRLFRWLKIIMVIVVVAVVFFILFQAIAQVSFFEWLGDRIDNLRKE